MKLLSVSLLPALLLSATVATGTAHADGASRRVALADARAFPALTSGKRLPAADRLNHRIHAERGGSITAAVRLCVAPDGKVSDVAIKRSSGMPAFDRAVTSGVTAWSYARYDAPAGTQVCETMSVKYVAR